MARKVDDFSFWVDMVVLIFFAALLLFATAKAVVITPEPKEQHGELSIPKLEINGVETEERDGKVVKKFSYLLHTYN